MIFNRQLQSAFFSIVHAEHCKLDSKWNYKEVVSPFSRIYLITDGNGLLTHHNQQFRLKKGYMYLIPEFTISCYQCDDFLEQYYLHIIHEIPGGESLFTRLAWKYEYRANEYDAWLFKRLLELNPRGGLALKNPKNYDNRPDLLENFKPKPVSDPSGYLESIGIIYQLLSRFLSKNDESSSSQKKKNERIVESLQFIQKNIGKKITVSELADRACLNVDYFSRIFKEMMGTRPISYINNKKIERAQFLLLTTNISLAEMSFKLGYENYNYFSRYFKTYTGISPSKFRDKINRNLNYV